MLPASLGPVPGADIEHGLPETRRLIRTQTQVSQSCEEQKHFSVIQGTMYFWYPFAVFE